MQVGKPLPHWPVGNALLVCDFDLVRDQLCGKERAILVSLWEEKQTKWKTLASFYWSSEILKKNIPNCELRYLYPTPWQARLKWQETFSQNPAKVFTMENLHELGPFLSQTALIPPSLLLPFLPECLAALCVEYVRTPLQVWLSQREVKLENENLSHKIRLRGFDHFFPKIKKQKRGYNRAEEESLAKEFDSFSRLLLPLQKIRRPARPNGKRPKAKAEKGERTKKRKQLEKNRKKSRPHV